MKPTVSIKPLNPRSADTKYTGTEPIWKTQPTDNRFSEMTRAFNWYGYFYGKKDAKEFVAIYLDFNGRTKDSKKIRALPDSQVRTTTGWLCRMVLMGLQLTEQEQIKLDNYLNELLSSKEEKVEDVAVEETASRPNIQDRLNEKMSECLGEVEGRFDEFVTAQQFKGEPKLIELFTQFNVQPAQLKTAQQLIENKVAEFSEILDTKDSQVLEAYKHLGKRQLNAIVKWWQQALADVNSYNIVKKASRAPRKKKAVSPEKVVSKLKFLKEFDELKLKSVEPTAILTATELWVYNTKTRKLGIYIVDQYAGALSVKGTKVTGFDAAASVQKTLRKPKEQLKEWASNGKPAAKKWFKGVRSTEIKLNGTINADMILLKAYK
jgi:hypothetical protein